MPALQGLQGAFLVFPEWRDPAFLSGAKDFLWPVVPSAFVHLRLPHFHEAPEVPHCVRSAAHSLRHDRYFSDHWSLGALLTRRLAVVLARLQRLVEQMPLGQWPLQAPLG